MNKNVVGASSTDPSGAKNKQAERSAQSDKKMFEADPEISKAMEVMGSSSYSKILKK